MDLNKVILVGRITRDPDIRTLPSGSLVAGVGLATNNYYTDKSGERVQQVEFHNLVAFNRNAEIIEEYCHKGDSLLVEGRLQTREWETKQGDKRRTTEILIDRLQLGSKPKGEYDDRGERSRPARRQSRYDDGQGGEGAEPDPEADIRRPAPARGRQTTQKALQKSVQRYSKPTREISNDDIPIIEEEEGTRGQKEPPESILNDENDDIDVKKIPF